MKIEGDSNHQTWVSISKDDCVVKENVFFFVSKEEGIGALFFIFFEFYIIIQKVF